MSLEEQIKSHVVPAHSLTLWWLGQAGLVLKSPGGTVVAIDPYLTNSCKAIGDEFGFDMDRMVPTPLEPAGMVDFDLYAMTHSHGDHLDPETLAGYRAAGGQGPYLAPPETVDKLVEQGVPREQIEMTWPNKKFALGDVEIRTTVAIPLGADDLNHVGYIVSVEDGPTLYATGDTAYHEILGEAAAPSDVNILFSVINPAFRNMCPTDAARLAKRLDVDVAIPCHWDMFPDNSLPPVLLRTNLKLEGIGDRYRQLQHGVAFTYTLGE